MKVLIEQANIFVGSSISVALHEDGRALVSRLCGSLEELMSGRRRMIRRPLIEWFLLKPDLVSADFSGIDGKGSRFSHLPEADVRICRAADHEVIFCR